ncbi:hypothetical protein EUX98_g4512 [Antrodiella citrinella]|uniref:DUF6589 domain-containing protein n=1 Tax=Antrodiella citrinella TaxID=2447956 RepID=A0A4S4MUP0_9APHY|nr:hypothetical protein EUX98_g4512 [Antrodiella citrinella]
MSFKWTSEAIKVMSSEAMAEVVEMIETYAWVASYDNLHLRHSVFNMKFDKKTDDNAGTAAIVHVKKDAPVLGPSINRALQRQRILGMKNPLQHKDILRLAMGSNPQIETFMEYEVLRILLDSTDFQVGSYRWRKDKLLEPPTPIHQLPHGPEHVSRRFMLQTMHINEGSLEGNKQVLEALQAQLGFKGEEKLKQLGREKIVWILGDQLTVDRIRSLQRSWCQEMNSTDRADYMIPVWGWLHFEMTEARSIHKQYLGAENGIVSLRRAFVALDRKNLINGGTQGNFHEIFVRTLHLLLEAHILSCWSIISEDSNLVQLRDKNPRELVSLAKKLVAQFASTKAMSAQVPQRSHPNPPKKAKTSAEPKKLQYDEVYRQTTMFLRDTLQFFVLKRAMKFGDVGLMEAILPLKLYRFVGGRNSHYTAEILELLQCLRNEWPDEVA